MAHEKCHPNQLEAYGSTQVPNLCNIIHVAWKVIPQTQGTDTLGIPPITPRLRLYKKQNSLGIIACIGVVYLHNYVSFQM